MNNLYLISQYENGNYDYDYDTYDSAVVVAESENAARLIHPDGTSTKGDWGGSLFDSWVHPDSVRVQLIGTCIQSVDDKEQLEAGTVVCASYNAG